MHILVTIVICLIGTVCISNTMRNIKLKRERTNQDDITMFFGIPLIIAGIIVYQYKPIIDFISSILIEL